MAKAKGETPKLDAQRRQREANWAKAQAKAKDVLKKRK